MHPTLSTPDCALIRRRLRLRAWGAVAALLASGSAKAAMDGLSNDNLPIVLLIVGIAFIGFWLAVAGAAKLLRVFYRQAFGQASTETAKRQGPASSGQTAEPALAGNTWGAKLGAFIWNGWVLVLVIQCLSLFWRVRNFDVPPPKTRAALLGVLALLVLILIPRLAAFFVRNVPQVPARLRQGLVWLAPLTVSLALAYDYGTRHHWKGTAPQRAIGLAELRPLSPAELSSLPLGGRLPPGTCQVRMRKPGDAWANALLISTVSPWLSGNPAESVYLLGLLADGPAVSLQGRPGEPWYAAISRSDLQWSLSSTSFQTQSALLIATQQQQISDEKQSLEKLLANRTPMTRKQDILGDPEIHFAQGFRRQIDVELNQQFQQRHWDCSQSTVHASSYCRNTQTGQQCLAGRSLQELCDESKTPSLSGSIINMAQPNHSALLAKKQSWFLWRSDTSAHPEFKAYCAVMGTESIDAAAREPMGKADLMCTEPVADKPGNEPTGPWIKAVLPYSALWLSQTQDRRAEFDKVQAAEDQLARIAATAAARIKALDDARSDITRQSNQHPPIQLWLRTIQSAPCTAVGNEVCQSFKAVLGAKSESVILEEQCADTATAQGASNFKTPMFQW